MYIFTLQSQKLHFRVIHFGEWIREFSEFENTALVWMERENGKPVRVAVDSEPDS